MIRVKIKLKIHIFILVSAIILITSLFVPASATRPDIQLSGGGRVTNNQPVGGTANFGFAVNGIATGVPQQFLGSGGHVQLILRGDDGIIQIVRSTTIETISFQTIGTYDRFTITGKCVLTMGEVILPNIDFDFYVWNDGGVDWIRLSGPFPYWVQGTLEGGHHCLKLNL